MSSKINPGCFCFYQHLTDHPQSKYSIQESKINQQFALLNLTESGERNYTEWYKNTFFFSSWVGLCYANLVCKTTHQLRSNNLCFFAPCEVPDLVSLETTVCLTAYLRSFRIIQRTKSTVLQSEPFERKKKKKIKRRSRLEYILLNSFRSDPPGTLSSLDLDGSAPYTWFLVVSYGGLKNNLKLLFLHHMDRNPGRLNQRYPSQMVLFHVDSNNNPFQLSLP